MIRGGGILAPKVMKRSASDNKYLHRDFHVSCDIGIGYVGERYGDEGVRDYLNQYTDNFLSPLAEAVRREGLEPLARYFRELYETEEASGQLELTRKPGALHVRVSACPAVAYMKSTGHQPSKWYRETTNTLYARLAKNAGLRFTLESYDEATGAAAFRFEQEANA